MEKKVDCLLCQRDAAKYVCPRCNVPYCSLLCYRSPIHSVRSEAFYRDCVTQELHSRPPDDEGRRRMLEILDRTHQSSLPFSDNEEDEDSSCDEDDLAARMAGVDLDDVSAVWERLTVTERADFLATAAREDSPLPWDPWWSRRHPPSSITPIDAPSRPYIDLCPPIRSPEPPPLSSLSSRPPAPELFNGVLSALAAYALIARHYAGDPSPPTPAAALFLHLSSALGQDVVFPTAEAAISAVSTAAKQIGLEFPSASDAAAIALGPRDDDPAFYALAALSHAHSIISAAIAESRNKPTTEDKNLPTLLTPLVPPAPRSRLRAVLRKLEYYISWTFHCYPPLFSKFKDSLITATQPPPVDLPPRI